MSGTIIGGQKAKITNTKKNPNFYREIGKLGGQVSHPETRYFAMNPAAAKIAGKKGGTISKRSSSKNE